MVLRLDDPDPSVIECDQPGMIEEVLPRQTIIMPQFPVKIDGESGGFFAAGQPRSFYIVAGGNREVRVDEGSRLIGG